MQPDHLTAETVAEYLKDNPDFFQHRPELVERLSFSHQQQGTVSLVEIQMRRQRQRIEELEEEITHMMSLAAKNDRTFHQLMDLQKSLLACESIKVLAQSIMQYSYNIGLKSHLLLLEHSNSDWHLSRDTYQRFTTNHLNGKDAYLGRLNRQDRYALFGGDRFANNDMSELGSYVILPLTAHNEPLGLLAFSSQEGGHFQPEMDTLFLRHLTELVAFMVKQLGEQAEPSDVNRLSCANES